jgi:transcription elongation factor/antiterminator RfaH
MSIEGPSAADHHPGETTGIQRWYALQTKPKKESFVEQCFKERGREVFLPWIRQRRRVGTRFVWASVPLFPGYVFCRLELETEARAVRYSPGVKDFVMFGDVVAEVGEDTVELLKARCPQGFAQFEPRPYVRGDKVLIREGALTGLEGVFEREMKGKDRVAVLLELLGRQTRLVVERYQIGRP